MNGGLSSRDDKGRRSARVPEEQGAPGPNDPQQCSMVAPFESRVIAVTDGSADQDDTQFLNGAGQTARTAWFRHCILLAAIFLCLLGGQSALQARESVRSDASSASDPDEQAAFNAVLDKTCNRRIVLLGENGFHGEGRTIGFKARLVEELVTRCGFRIVLFEASQYEFLNIERRARSGDAVSEAQISAAIGQIWNQNREMDRLITFLADAKSHGRFIVGGLDDQLGSRGLLFGNDPMITELTGLLSQELQQACSERLLRRTYSAYSQEAPYTTEERDRMRACVGATRQALLTQPATDDGPFLRAMLDNLDRYLARDFESDAQRIAGRAASMHANFRWWLANRGKVGPKVIVWAANSHVAEGRGIDPLYDGAAPLGNLIAADFGKRSFSVGFSANAGTFRWSRTETKAISTKTDSLENRAIGTSGKTAVFLSGRDLGRRMEIGGLFNHQFYRAEWRKFFDGIVVFQAERPPNRVNN